MDPNKEQKSWNRELTPQEKRIGLAIVSWFAACIWIGIFFPKIGFGLLLAGIAIAFIISAGITGH